MATFEWGEFVFTLIQSPIADPQPRSPAMLFHGASFTLFHRNIDILTFNAQEALSAVPDSTSLKVHSHASWTMARPHSQALYTPQYDWTFYSLYSGTTPLTTETTTTKIDFNMLQRRDPIRFYDQCLLYEDELDDNGVSQYSVKVRVMDSCFLILARSLTA